MRGATLCMELCWVLMQTVWKCGELVAGSVPFVVIDFEVILGMDQLTRYYATLDYRVEAVIFKLPNDEEFRFRGDKSSMPHNLISASQLGRCLDDDVKAT